MNTTLFCAGGFSAWYNVMNSQSRSMIDLLGWQCRIWNFFSDRSKLYGLVMSIGPIASESVFENIYGNWFFQFGDSSVKIN